MKAIDAVENLRKLADLLENHPEAEIRYLCCNVRLANKESFLGTASNFMRPYAKKYEDSEHGDLIVAHGDMFEGGLVNLMIERSKVCRLVEPAKPAVYSCDPILSADEEAQLEGAK